MQWLLNLIGPAIELLNNIFKLFKKPVTEKIEDKVSDHLEEIDEQIEDAGKK